MKQLPKYNYMQELDKYTRGWTIIRGVVSSDEINLLRNKILAINSTYDSSVGTDKLKRRTALLMNDREAAGVVVNIVKHPGVESIFGNYIEPAIEHTKVLIKARGAPETPWHQDSGFWKDIDPQGTMFTVWIPIGDIDKDSGCLRILDTGPIAEGEHYLHNPVHAGQEREMDKTVFNNLALKYPIVDCPMKSGDALVFKSWVIHSAYSNKTQKERMAFKVVFQDLAKRPVKLSRRGVKLRGIIGVLNSWNACMVTRWNLRIHSVLLLIKSTVKSVL